MQSNKTLKMAQMAILIAIILVMAFTPIGYLRTGGLEISLITIPVAIGAMILGPAAGALFGGIFGITSFYQCFGLSPFGATLLGINPVATFLVCVPTRILMGFLTGWITKLILKLDKTNTVSYFVGGAIAALLNTLFFMSTLMLFFGNSDYIQSMNPEGLSVVLFVAMFVGINGLLEVPATCIAGGTVSKALAKMLKTQA
ncbi:MAG: ECF transporter S component [Lachnospiraceae bacterium]